MRELQLAALRCVWRGLVLGNSLLAGRLQVVKNTATRGDTVLRTRQPFTDVGHSDDTVQRGAE